MCCRGEPGIPSGTQSTNILINKKQLDSFNLMSSNTV